MDCMKIESEFMTGLISGLVTRILKKKAGYDIDIRLNGIRISVDESGNVRAHISADADIPKTELTKILGDKL